jgi:hypothetical protein
MKPLTRIFASLFLIGTTFSLPAQDVPTLTDNDLLHQEDLKKKSGWMKIELDSNFQAIKNNSAVKYAFYEFVNDKGQYNSTYRDKLPFPKNMKITFLKNASEETGLLNGTVNFYDKANNIVLQYIFKNGFYIKAADYKNGGLNTIIEYIPKKNSVELFANYFNAAGKVSSTSHEENNGHAYISLPEQKLIRRPTN